MDRRRFIILFCFILAAATQLSYGAPIMYRVQQKKMMEQHQQIIIQQEIEVHHRAGLVVDDEQRPPTYQEMVDRRNQAIAQAILNAHQTTGNLNATLAKSPPPTFFQWIISILRYIFSLLKNFIDWLIGLIWNKAPDQTVRNENPETGNIQVQQQASSPEAGPQEPAAAPNNPGQQQDFTSVVAQQATPAATEPAPAPASAGPVDTQEVVDLSEVWKKLDKKSTIWSILGDDQAKLSTISEYIGRFQKEGVKINQPPAHYVQMIDQIAVENPQMLQRPFGELLQVMAIVDYDFDNGMDRDALAKQVLGEEGYEANKKRFAQLQQAQEQQQQQQQQH